MLPVGAIWNDWFGSLLVQVRAKLVAIIRFVPKAGIWPAPRGRSGAPRADHRALGLRNRMAIRRPLASASAWIFVLRPPRERPTACFFSPFSAGCGAVGFHVGGVDHLHICGSSVPGELPKQIFPDAAPRPPNKPVVACRRRTVFGRAIAPAAAASQHMDDSTDDAPIVSPLHTSNIRRQIWLDPLPLLITQPKQILAHDPDAPNGSIP